MIKFGYENEKNFCGILNDKFINQLEEKYIKLLKIIFEENLDSKTYIACWKSFKTDKADIVIRAGKIKKYISIKSGKNNSIHLESLQDFKKYLKELNFPEELIKIYEKYHYATEENKRLSIKVYQEKHQDEIQKFNQFANQEAILNKVIDHFLFTGNSENSHPVDAIIYGTPENFICLKKQDIINYLLTQNEEFNSIHFSSLVLQPWTRNLNFNPKYEYRRKFVQVKWYRLEEIFQQIKTSLSSSTTDHVGKEKTDHNSL